LNQDGTSEYTLLDILRGEIPPTRCMMIRNSPEFWAIRKRLKSKYYGGDNAISYASAVVGKIINLPDLTATYRMTGSGVWTCHSGYARFERGLKGRAELHTHLGLFPNEILDNVLVDRCVNWMRTNRFSPKISWDAIVVTSRASGRGIWYILLLVGWHVLTRILRKFMNLFVRNSVQYGCGPK